MYSVSTKQIKIKIKSKNDVGRKVGRKEVQSVYSVSTKQIKIKSKRRMM